MSDDNVHDGASYVETIADAGASLPVVGGVLAALGAFAKLIKEAVEQNQAVKAMHIALHHYAMAFNKAAREAVDQSVRNLVEDATSQLRNLFAAVETHAEAKLSVMGCDLSNLPGSRTISQVLGTSEFRRKWEDTTRVLDALVQAMQIGLAGNVLAATHDAARAAREANEEVVSGLNAISEKVDVLGEEVGALRKEILALRSERTDGKRWLGMSPPLAFVSNPVSNI